MFALVCSVLRTEIEIPVLFSCDLLTREDIENIKGKLEIWYTS